MRKRKGHTKMLLFPIHYVLESQGWPEFSWKTLGRWKIARDESGSCRVTQWCGWTFCVSRNKEVNICATHITTSWSLLSARWFLKTLSPLFLYFITLTRTARFILPGINKQLQKPFLGPSSSLPHGPRGLYNC